jgi:hypothetical protein
VPLARFTVGQLALALPFVALGFGTVAARLSAPVRHGLVGVTALIAVAMPAWLGMFTLGAEQGAAAALIPVSPVSTNPPSVMEVARFLGKRVAPESGLVVLDADAKFRDLQVGFFSGLPEERLARVRWDDFESKLTAQTPDYLVRVEGGDLEKRSDFAARGGHVVLGETWFEELGGFRAPLHVYRRVRAEERPHATGTAQEMLRERLDFERPLLVPAPPPSAAVP